jgi:hypothetical protein
MYSLYKSSAECYNSPIKQVIKYSAYKGPVQAPIKENYNSNRCMQNHIPIKVYVPPDKTPVQEYKPKPSDKTPTIKWETKQYSNLSDPKVWGPAFWFILHTGAAKYPLSASPIISGKMKSYIIGIPTMLPCIICQTHATNHIEKNMCNLDDICSGRDKLFKFFVIFHNIVNKRYNKPVVSVEDAYKIYNEGINVNIMTIKNN